MKKLSEYVNPANGYRLFNRSDLERFLKKTAKASEAQSIAQQLDNPHEFIERYTSKESLCPD